MVLGIVHNSKKKEFYFKEFFFNVIMEVVKIFMKKIAILSLHLGYGGIEKTIVTLANSLCSKYKVEIACCYQLYDKSVFNLDKRVKVIFLNPHLKPNREEFLNHINNKRLFSAVREGFTSVKVLYKRKKSITSYIRNSDADVIISTRDIFNYWLSGYAKDSVLKIGWEHNHYHNDLKYAQNISRSARKLDYLVLVSYELCDFYKKQLSNTNCMCVMIPNAIDTMPKKVAPLKNKRIISVGRLSKEKGYLDLLKVYSILRKKHPDWTLDIVGDGSEKAVLERYIKNNHLEESVTLHGFLGKEEIDSLLHDSSIYLMTSYTESFGIVLIEAMSHRVPCIAFDSAEGAKEIIVSGENGFLIRNRNINAMVQKVEDLMEHPEKRIKIGDRARESVKKYTSDIVGEEWITLIEESGVYE
jgi:glycosyltransferase involved in cell wall biosynthesis